MSGPPTSSQVAAAMVMQSEAQLYHVLQRANLLAYYEAFLEKGGDDVLQLCEASEDEFMEIVRLVGMSGKPLHVRRLQRALHDWGSSLYQLVNLNAAGGTGSAAYAPAIPAAISCRLANPPAGSILSLARRMSCAGGMAVTPLSSGGVFSPAVGFSGPSSPGMSPSGFGAAQLTGQGPPGGSVPRSIVQAQLAVSPGSGTPPTAESMDATASPPPPTLNEEHSIPDSPQSSSLSTAVATMGLAGSQIEALAEAAEAICHSLQEFEPRPLNLKKQLHRDLEIVMKMNDSSPQRMALLRKYAAIYGRFDSKRKSDKPMSLHEMSVNEAAAQLCRVRPVLLSRRDELFPLARRVVRESGYVYSKGHSRAAAAAAAGAAAAEECCTPPKQGRILASDHDAVAAMNASGDTRADISCNGNLHPVGGKSPAPSAAASRYMKRSARSGGIDHQRRLAEIDLRLRILASRHSELKEKLQDACADGRRGSSCDGASSATPPSASTPSSSLDDLRHEIETLEGERTQLESAAVALLFSSPAAAAVSPPRGRCPLPSGSRSLSAGIVDGAYPAYGCSPMTHRAVNLGMGQRASYCKSSKSEGDDRGSITSTDDGAFHEVDAMNFMKTVKVPRQFVQESLFDEGLRIARQYGALDDAATPSAVSAAGEPAGCCPDVDAFKRGAANNRAGGDNNCVVHAAIAADGAAPRSAGPAESAKVSGDIKICGGTGGLESHGKSDDRMSTEASA